MLVQVGVDGDEVRFAQQHVEIDLAGAEFRLGLLVAVNVVIENLHVPAAGAALRQGVADAAHADDAERAADQVLAEMAERLPRLPLSGSGIVVTPSTSRRAAAISRQKAMSAVASVSTPGVLPTQDAAGRGGGHIHVVEADGVVADDA